MIAAVAKAVARLTLAACLVASALTPPPAKADAVDASDNTLATIRSEVRLRKLHLVRPDLIPYPIAYEVCC